MVDCAQDSHMQKELDRRLSTVLSEEYDDPARANISKWELVIWFGIAVAIAVVTETVRMGL